jgi:hypothetical protein
MPPGGKAKGRHTESSGGHLLRGERPPTVENHPSGPREVLPRHVPGYRKIRAPISIQQTSLSWDEMKSQIHSPAGCVEKSPEMIVVDILTLQGLRSVVNMLPDCAISTPASSSLPCSC